MADKDIPPERRAFTWDQTEAADAFVAHAERWGTDAETLRTIAKLAEDTDEAVAIWDFIERLRQGAAAG